MTRLADDLRLSCQCGELGGSLTSGAPVSRCVCYCRSCQAFAHHLDRQEMVLDPAGGSQILQTQPRFIVFDRGGDALACTQLTDRGPLRWFSACCRTPVGNTLATARLPFVGLLRAFVAEDEPQLDRRFGPTRIFVHTEGALGDSAPPTRGLYPSMARLIVQMARARLTGAWRTNPFFDTESGRPAARPQVLDTDARRALYGRLAGANDRAGHGPPPR